MPLILQTAEKEYEKNPDIKREDIEKLREWLSSQPHLPKLTDEELIVFYHSCENSMSLTKTTIDINYTLRTHLHVYFDDRDPKNEKHLLCMERVLIAVLPGTTPEGYKAVYSRLLDPEPAHFHFDLSAKLFTMMSDIDQLENGTYPGVIIILDMDKVVLGHLGRLSLIGIKNTLNYLQEAMPVRLKGFHFLNTPSFMDKILAMMKPFMKKSFMDMLHLHPAPIDTIYKYVPKDMFPEDIGGKSPSFEKLKDDTIAKLTENRQFFIDELKQRIDESKRPGKPKDAGEVFGVEGSFKKLCLD